jgi:alkanesulfonate monooxygenase SsuD/methylene tetrahydromethanopterin reductase-like flavin-dependent oxidoreductase (luciferase family)
MDDAGKAPLYWEVEMKVFAFDTEAEARAFNDALIDAFCAMPQAEGFASSHRVIGCYDYEPVEWKPRLRAPTGTEQEGR